MADSIFFPWLKHFDQEELREFFAEVAQVATEEGYLGDLRPEALDTVLAAWRSTAEVKADPELYAALTSAIDGEDCGPVLIPAGCLDPELCITPDRCPNCDPEESS